MEHEQLQSRLRDTGDSISAEVVEALAANLEEGERIEYVLTSGNGVERLDDGGDSITASDDGATTVLLTDRKLLFAVETPTGPVVGPIPFTEIKQVDWNDGLVRSYLDVVVWSEGTYRVKPSETDQLRLIGTYVEKMSDSWDVVVSALGDARQHINEYGNRIETGDLETAKEHRQAAREKIKRARKRVNVNGPNPADGLHARIDAVDSELFETAMEGAIHRSLSLRERASDHERARRYRESHESFRQALQQLENALQLAIEHNFDRVDEIRSDLDALERRIAELEKRPLAEAESAHEEAREAEPRHAITLYHEALERYRAALTAGWGVDRADFDGDHTELRERIELVVEELLQTRKEIAEQLLEDADAQAFAGEPGALNNYDAGAQQLGAARELASQYRAGDEARIETRLAEVRAARRELDGDAAEV